MRKLLIIISLVQIPLGLMSKEKASRHFTYGVEWSYIASFHCGIHHNFFSQEGYRVDLNHQGFDFESNGEVNLHCGFNIKENWNISLHSGIVGIYDIGKSVPVSLRFTRFFNEDRRGDRWLCYLDAGSGVCLKQNPQMIAVGKLGGGYRMSLSNTTKMDFLFAYRMSLTHPNIVFDGYSVPFEMTNRNNAYVSAFSIGISLTF